LLAFLKLGGSLITDKTRERTPRLDVLVRLADEIAAALDARPDLQLLVGHGSGSYGHVAAERHGTRQGVRGRAAWRGFAEVATIAAQLSGLVTDALHRAGVPIFRVQPSASARCQAGRIVSMELEPIRRALAHGLVPLVHGDVAIDDEQGGTIISTEDIFIYLAEHLKPVRILLAGDVPGVLDERDRVIPEITPADLERLERLLGGSHGVDVTGGMASKVRAMLSLCQAIPGLQVHILSGGQPGLLTDALIGPDAPGTRLSAK
jgi:isopentenyl phosphate kinase